MTRYWVPLAISAALGLVPGSHAADLTKPTRFGSLEAATVEAAQAQSAAWLKAGGKMEGDIQAKFEQLWKSDVSLLDKVVGTFEMGDPAAAKLMADARDPSAPAPMAAPPILKDQTLPMFFRANLTLGYGRALSNRAVHEEAIEALKIVPAEQVVDPAAYLFHRAISEHAMLDKSAALATINRLLDDVATAPERYRTLAALMALDIHTWNEKDLASISRKMKSVERRLDLARGGPVTQKIQKDIVARLDEMIKELENQAKGAGASNGGNCPGGAPGQGQAGGNNPSNPLPDSQIVPVGGDGRVEQAKLKKLVEQWGNLPPREQARALQELTQGMSPRHREAIENYFRNLAVAQNRK
jgi:hypothetical protein